MRVVLPVFVLCAAAATSGCVATVASAALGAATLTVQDRPIGQGIDDASGAAVIRARLLSADHSAYLGIGVGMSGGHVVLTGSVPTAEHRERAEHEAWTVPSVQGVSNELEVGPRAGLWRAARDEALGAQVRASLIADSRIKSINFGVNTHKGVVYLTGLARTEEEMRLAAETASLVPGTGKVVSFVVVRPTPSMLQRPDVTLVEAQ